jgi:polyisoprenoid-binding protein YceI
MPALAVSAFALTASAALPEIAKGSQVAFRAAGPGGLAIDGTGESVTVEAGKDPGSVVFKTSLRNLKTGMDLRDKHLKKYLDVEHWPDSSLTLTESQAKDAAGGKKFDGSLKLHGVTKPVKVTQKPKDGGVDASFEVDITKFGIEKPCYLGVCVDPIVKLTVHVVPKR